MATWTAQFVLVALFVGTDGTMNLGNAQREVDNTGHGEIRAHSARDLERDNQKSGTKRLIRKEVEATSTEVAADAEEEVPLDFGRRLMQTRHAAMASQAQRPSLLQGPGTLEPVEDAWKKSIEMLDLYDKNLTYDCSLSYGRQMLKNLLQERNAHHVCQGSNISITCHERVPFDISRYTCALKNISISAEGTSAPGCKKNAYDSFVESEGIAEKKLFGEWTHLKGIDFSEKPIQCKEMVTGKALVQIATDTQNFYEWYGDWVTLWETMAALGWHPKDTDLYLVGMLSGGGREFARPFDEAWSRMFRSRLHVGSMEQLFGDGTCFRQIYTVPQGSLSTLSFHGGRAGSVPCSSPLVMSSALYLQALFPPLANASKPSRKHVTVLQRKGGVRAWNSDVMVVRDIQDMVPDGWGVSGYRPEDYPTFEAQLNVVQHTQVFVGIHGAGMMHVLFLPPAARIVEVFCGDRPRLNHHFRNLVTLGEPNVGAHLFHYYFENDIGRCKIDQNVMKKAVEAYEAGPYVEPPKAKREV
mmetsp:Transcript_53368/g.95867  ORF Transcript_53368/g.95867 Transcript_53368/m.95867 type:complete len:527 (+) Transcript_53368:53-1633(+)